jgi:Flp pilus assembly protein TadB
MATALIIGLTLGAQKIQEKREKKKEKKALMEFANEQREAKLRNDQASRREEKRSGSLEREDEEVPPPSYEDVVAESAQGRRR